MRTVYLSPLYSQTEAALEEAFAQLTYHAPPVPETLEVQGRTLRIARTYGGIALLSFAELCEKPLGSADYLALAKRFHTLCLSGIPLLGPEKRNEARRFVTLIDTLYDHKVKLICTAAAEPEALYAEGDGVFEFRRTVSRLTEMRSEAYFALPHVA